MFPATPSAASAVMAGQRVLGDVVYDRGLMSATTRIADDIATMKRVLPIDDRRR
jgi:hypothetical protein